LGDNLRKAPEGNPEEAFIVESVIGILAFNSENEVVEKNLFPANPEIIASALLRLERGEAIVEAKEILRRLSKRGFRAFIFENKALAKTVEEEMKLETRFEGSTAAGNLLRSRLVEMALEMGVIKSREDAYALIQEVSTRIASERVTEESEKMEPMIVQAVQVLDELDKMINILSTKAREWYSIHFPELSRLVDEHETYMKLVVNLSERENFTTKSLEEIGVPSPLSGKVVEKASRSLGGSLRTEDLETIKGICREVLSLHKLRKNISDYIASLSEEVAPNTVEVGGPLLTAKLIAKAGSLMKLAMMPSSRIQILGAEKAMFRSMKTGSRPPKHGLIFQHPLIHSAPRRQRGKLARALAGKLTMAARVDAYSKRFIGDKLKEDLEERIQKLTSSKDKKDLHSSDS